MDPEDLDDLKGTLTPPVKAAEGLLAPLLWAIEALPGRFVQEGPLEEFQEDLEGAAESQPFMAPQETTVAAAAGGAVNPVTE